VKFWGARVSRIWPTHALTFLLCLALIPPVAWVPGGDGFWPALANITLTQSLVPVPQYYFSYNAPSWSISTEAYFYVFYPLAAFAMARRIWAPVAIGAVMVIAAVAVSVAVNLPPYNADTLTSATAHGMMLANPIVRFFEFACGMAAAHLWTYLKERPAPGVGSSTLLELAMGLLAILSIVLLQDVASAMEARGWHEAVTLWVRLGASAVPFAAFILVLALERGALAKLLSFRVMVVLGEVSFAMYMLHQLALRYMAEREWRAEQADGLMFTAFCAAIIAASYGVWVIVERPSRRVLNKFFARLAT
jgi:peptidoglycan/LPS O-acetylase OafA/YrhL